MGGVLPTSTAAVHVESVHLLHEGLAEAGPMALDLAGVGAKEGEATLWEAAAGRPQSRIHGQGGCLAGVGHVHQTWT